MLKFLSKERKLYKIIYNIINVHFIYTILVRFVKIFKNKIMSINVIIMSTLILQIHVKRENLVV
jgi:hypothetical protein